MESRRSSSAASRSSNVRTAGSTNMNETNRVQPHELGEPRYGDPKLRALVSQYASVTDDLIRDVREGGPAVRLLPYLSLEAPRSVEAQTLWRGDRERANLSVGATHFVPVSGWTTDVATALDYVGPTGQLTALSVPAGTRMLDTGTTQHEILLGPLTLRVDAVRRRPTDNLGRGPVEVTASKVAAQRSFWAQ